jgi:hypothetical protein
MAEPRLAAAPVIDAAARRVPWRVVLAVGAGFAATLAWFATAPDAAARQILHADAELVLLLRFMASIKATMALAVLAAAFWRLGFAVAPRQAVAYVAAAALACSAIGPIWHLSQVALGAAFLYGGLALFAVTMFSDRGNVLPLLETVIKRLLGRA